jgi:outer membrane protein assembly factor BamB
VKQVKKLFLITFSLFTLILASCAPSGTQPAQGWSGTVSHNDMLYIGSMDGKVVAVNWSTQNLEWSYTIATHSSGSMSCSQTSIPTAMYGTPAVDRDLVYIGTYDGRVLSLSASARSQNLPFPQIRNGE